jgi:hypothetical protein
LLTGNIAATAGYRGSGPRAFLCSVGATTIKGLASLHDHPDGHALDWRRRCGRRDRKRKQSIVAVWTVELAVALEVRTRFLSATRPLATARPHRQREQPETVPRSAGAAVSTQPAPPFGGSDPVPPACDTSAKSNGRSASSPPLRRAGQAASLPIRFLPTPPTCRVLPRS